MAAIPPLTVEEQLELLAVQDIDFPEYQRYSQDRFWMYRSGRQPHTRSLDAIVMDSQAGYPQRLNRILNRQIPRVNYTAQLTDDIQTGLERRAVQNRSSYRRVGAAGAAGGANLSPAQKQVATDEFQRATAMMTARRSFHFVKILGSGGNGMVVLFKWTPGGNPLEQGHYVVMKLITDVDVNGDPRNEVIDEEERYMFVSGASPQRVVLAMHDPAQAELCL